MDRDLRARLISIGQPSWQCQLNLLCRKLVASPISMLEVLDCVGCLMLLLKAFFAFRRSEVITYAAVRLSGATAAGKIRTRRSLTQTCASAFIPLF
jgi:hypothetical protein